MGPQRTTPLVAPSLCPINVWACGVKPPPIAEFQSVPEALLRQVCVFLLSRGWAVEKHSSSNDGIHTVMVFVVAAVVW